MREWIFIFCIVPLLWSCATIHTEPVTGETLREKAETYWKLREEKKYDAAYKMEDTEGLPPFADYLGKVREMKKVVIQSRTVKDAAVLDDGKGIVNLQLTYLLPPVSKPFTQITKDHWVYRNGAWLHVLPR